MIIYDVAVLLKFSVLSFLVSRHSSTLNLWSRYINYRSNARQAREDFWLYGVQNNFCGSSPSLLLTPFYKSKRLANPWRNLLRPSRRQERKSRSKSASLLWKVRTRVQKCDRTYYSRRTKFHDLCVKLSVCNMKLYHDTGHGLIRLTLLTGSFFRANCKSLG